MNLEINGKTIEVKFTIGAIEQLDKIYTVNKGGANFGMGISSALAYLSQCNPVVLKHIIEALQVNDRKVGASEMEAWLFTQDIEALCDQLIDELGKQPLTKAIVKKMRKAQEAQRKTQEA